jgi:hypothetical protein
MPTDESFAWVALIAFETLAFGLTLYKTFTLSHRAVARPTLPILLLRDGAVFYAVMSLGGLANVLALNVSPTPFC